MKTKSDEKHNEDVEKLVCIGVDAKTDKETLIFKEVIDIDGVVKLKKDRAQEHHLTFTKEPGTEKGTYLTHKTLPIVGATGVRLAEETLDVLNEFNSLETLMAILVDNTSTNTGCNAGLVTSLEKKIGRKLHTIGCALHQNELPFRAVFKHLDGVSKSPNTFSGPLGKLCENNYEDLPQVEFTNISGNLDNIDMPEKVKKDLSSDQRLLLEYVQGISIGKVNPQYAAWKIGPLNHDRWLTLSIRLMCIWTRGTYPLELYDTLFQLIKFIVQVYAVSWFEIKRDGKFHNQPLYIYIT